MSDLDLKNECMEDAEIDLTRYSNNELTQIREAMRMYAERKLKLFAIPDVIKSVCGDCLYYLTCNHESRNKQICDNYDNEP